MLEIRSYLGEEVTRRLTRWRSTAVLIVQAALAAGVSWLAAVHIVDHRAPFFAPVAAVVCLGMTARSTVASSARYRGEQQIADADSEANSHDQLG